MPGVQKLRNLSAASIGFASRASSQLVNLLITLLASRFVSPSEFGQFAIAMAITVFLQTMTYSGVYDQLLRERQEELDADTAFWMLLGYSIVGSLVFAALAYPMEWLFRSPDLAWVILWMVAVQPIAAVSAWTQALMLREGKTTRYYVITIVGYLATFVVAAAALFLLEDLRAMIVYRWMVVLSTAIFFWAAWPKLPRFHFDLAAARRILAQSGALYGARSLTFVYGYGADFLLGVLLTPAATGIYRFAVRIGNGISDVINQPLRTFAWIHLSRLWREDQPMQREIERFLTMSAVLLSVAMGFVAGIIELAVHLLLDPQWRAVVPVFYGVAATRMFTAADTIVDAVLGVRGRSAVLLRYRSLATVALLGAAAVFAVLGPAAVAWGQAAATIATAVVALFFIHREIGTATWRLAASAMLPVGFGMVAFGLTLATGRFARFAPMAEAAQLGVTVAGGLVVSVLAVLVAWRLRLVNFGLMRG